MLFTVRYRELLFMAMAVGVFAMHASAQPCLDGHLTPLDNSGFKNFGRAVAISGNTAIIGAHTDGEQWGTAYIFKFDGVSWAQTQKLLASEGTVAENFGKDVAIEGSTAVVTATGRAYVYDEAAGLWLEQQILFPADGTPGFGRTVAIHDGVVVVATISDHTQGSSAGAAWVFRHNGTEWVEEQKLLASDGAMGHFFGDWQSVAVDGDFIAIGANGHTGPGAPPGTQWPAGAVYIFRHNGDMWVEEQIISHYDPKAPLASASFGDALDLDGDLLVIGHPHFAFTPSAFVYRYDPKRDEWVQEQEIASPPGAVSSGFGRSVAIENDTIVIGDWLYASDGAAFVYEPDADGQWQLTQSLLPLPNQPTAFLGTSVAIEGGRTIIGANGESGQTGAAYIYDLTCNDPAREIPGDLDGDGTVGVPDLLILLSAWGECENARNCPADLDHNGSVGVADLLILLANWG